MLLRTPLAPSNTRSVSADPNFSPALPRAAARSGSTPQLPQMAAVTTAPGLPPSRLQLDAESLSTIPDPRSPDEFPSPQRSASSSPHPDLNSEVATLSNKLISAINHQTNLDDTLTATRQELDSTRDRLRHLEVENKEHANLIAAGVLIRKVEAEEQASRLVAKLAEERKRRAVVEKDKKGIEQELENLTTALFEEANQVSWILFSIAHPCLFHLDGCCCPEGTGGCRAPERPASNSTK